jgi:hypothetical protein
LKILAFSSGMTASYAISVRQASVLPAASFRFHLTMDTLAVRLTVPPVGPVEDFHLQVNAPCRAHQKKGPVENFLPAFSYQQKMRKLLLHASFEHCFAFVSSGFASASGVLGSHRGSLGCSGAGCALLFDGLGLIHSCLAKLRAFLAIILAGTTGDHGKSQCNNKQNCHYSLHSLSSLETYK